MTDFSPTLGLAQQSRAFVDWLGEWYAALGPLPLQTAIAEPSRAALCTVDMLNGFCYEGQLSSPRAALCVDPIAGLFRNAHAHGVRNFVSIQEWHSERAQEFHSFPPHCIRGTHEAELVAPLATLPFAADVKVFHKNSLHTIVGTGVQEWLDRRGDLDTFIVTGVCTDLCIYDLAMDLKLRANAQDIPRRVIVPANAVNTYDLTVETASQVKALPHDADFLHRLFLFMMALNGILVASEIV